jgi:hypothetical protein
MTAITLQSHTGNQSDYSPSAFVNDSFWSLLVLASLMLATLVGIQQLL